MPSVFKDVEFRFICRVLNDFAEDFNARKWTWGSNANALTFKHPRNVTFTYYKSTSELMLQGPVAFVASVSNELSVILQRGYRISSTKRSGNGNPTDNIITQIRNGSPKPSQIPRNRQFPSTLNCIPTADETEIFEHYHVPIIKIRYRHSSSFFKI